MYYEFELCTIKPTTNKQVYQSCCILLLFFTKKKRDKVMSQSVFTSNQKIRVQVESANMPNFLFIFLDHQSSMWEERVIGYLYTKIYSLNSKGWAIEWFEQFIVLIWERERERERGREKVTNMINSHIFFINYFKWCINYLSIMKF